MWVSSWKANPNIIIALNIEYHILHKYSEFESMSYNNISNSNGIDVMEMATIAPAAHSSERQQSPKLMDFYDNKYK